MKLKIEYGIPFVEIILMNDGKEKVVKNVLIDTGAASSIISTDIAVEVGLSPSPNDVINRVRGVGGYEYVYEKSIEVIKVDDIEILDFTIEVGDMDYGFNIDGILGTDFLRIAKATINMEKLLLEFNNRG